MKECTIDKERKKRKPSSSTSSKHPVNDRHVSQAPGEIRSLTGPQKVIINITGDEEEDDPSAALSGPFIPKVEPS